VTVQIAAYCVSAVAGGSMFYLWRRLDVEGRQRVWRLYGWFTALMLCGSCFGVVSWSGRMRLLVNSYQSDDLNSSFDANSTSVISDSLYLSASGGTLVTSAIEFMCLSAAQLMVLDRMSHFVTSQGDGARKWAVGGRAVMAAVVLCNTAGIAANIAAAVYFKTSADAYSAASVLYASNSTSNDALAYLSSGRSNFQLANSIFSIRSFCEVSALLLIVLVFSVVGIACIRRLSSALTLLDTAGTDMAAQHNMRPGSVSQALALGRRLRQEVVVTTSFVFIAFLLRSVVSTLLAVAKQSQDVAKTCPGVTSLCDASCYNLYTHIVQWNGYTPEFLSTVVLVSSPLTLLVALWSMTSKLTLQLMRSRQRPMAPSTASPVGLNAMKQRLVSEDV
jgi:hypothetical protein